MATKEEKIQKIEKELKMLKATLTKYGDIFNANGYVDSEEQKQLETMQAVIKKIEAKLVDMRKGTSDNPERVKMNKELRELEMKLESLMTLYGLT